MKFRKLCNLILVFVTPILALPQTSSSVSQLQQCRQPVDTPTCIADGGAPVPPVPKRPSGNAVIADGGAPVPPVPPRPSNVTPQVDLEADGGAPVPPVPTVKSVTSMADGGAPVPPVPTEPQSRLASSFVV
jgi:hypothetical protein